MHIARKIHFRVARMISVIAIAVLTLNACGGGSDEATRLPDEQKSSVSWLMRGGDVHRASMMSEWSSLDEESRLASAADLVSMSNRRENRPHPDGREFERLARALEAKLTAINADGSRDSDYVGAVVDEIWPSISE